MEQERDFQAETNEQGRSFAAEAKEQIAALNLAIEAEDTTAEDEARSNIEAEPLSITVRSDWYVPGTEEGKPAQFCILLGTGGPASRIIGDLDEYGSPESAHYEFQDWGTPWTRAQLTGEEEDALTQWAQNFYFGE